MITEIRSRNSRNRTSCKASTHSFVSIATDIRRDLHLLAVSVDFESPSRPPLRLRSSSAYPGSFGIRVTSGDLISAVIWLAPTSILRVRRTFTHRTRLLQRGRATEGNRLRLFDADRGRREAEICVPSRHPTRGQRPRGITRVTARAIAVDVARPPRQ